MITLYHGTGETAAQNIFATAKLAATGVAVNYPVHLPMATQAGFLYLTDKLFVAIDYATMSEVDKKAERKGYVFKVEIDPNIISLEADIQDLRQFYANYDPKKQYTYAESLLYCGSVRTRHDLHFGIHVKEYFEFETGPISPRNDLSTEAREKIRRFSNVSDFSPSLFKWIPV